MKKHVMIDWGIYNTNGVSKEPIAWRTIKVVCSRFTCSTYKSVEHNFTDVLTVVLYINNFIKINYHKSGNGLYLVRVQTSVLEPWACRIAGFQQMNGELKALGATFAMVDRRHWCRSWFQFKHCISALVIISSMSRTSQHLAIWLSNHCGFNSIRCL